MMMRLSIPMLALLAFCLESVATAQVVVWKQGQTSISDSIDQPDQSRPAWEAPRSIRLTPAAEPSPALAHRFWIPPIERQPGDVKIHVDRVIVMYLQHPLRKKLDEQYREITSQLTDGPTQQFRLPEALQGQIHEYLGEQSEILKQLHYALNLANVRSDYALRDMRGSDVYTYNLADIQNLRAMARLVHLQCQLAMAEGRYVDAIGAIRDGYRIAELAMRSGEGTLVSQLVSLAIVGLMNTEVEAMAQLPGSPNTYWALASLPRDQLFSIQSAIDGESIAALHALFPWGVGQPADSETEAEKRLGKLIELAHIATEHFPITEKFDATQSSQYKAVAALIAVLFADRARDELANVQLGNCQAVLQWTQSEFVELRDELFKWMMLPTQERIRHEALIADYQVFLRAAIPDSPGKLLVGLVLPAYQAADAAVQRTQRQHALLITLEALRAHAAEHDGQLPVSLEELRPLPAWSDPTTGKPFEYRRTATGKATLITAKSLGIPNEFHIEIVTQP